MNFLTKNKLLFSATLAILFSLFLSNVSFAQPANDECTNAIEIQLHDENTPCVWVEGTTLDATSSVDPVSVCSNSWKADDVWFYFTTPASLYDSLDLVIKLDFGANPTDILSAGMALYSSCGTSEEPIACFSSANPDEKELLALKCLLSETTTYYVRVWSGGSPSDNSGTFSICATSTLNAIEVGNEVVVWEEQFDGGIGDWTAENCAFDTTTWEWVNPAVDYWTGRLLLSPSTCNGAMLFDAARYNDENGVSAQPYPDHHCELVSPTIDCSTFGTVKLQFHQYNLALNGNTSDGKTFFAYSLDNGASWSDNIAVDSENELTSANNNIVGTEVRRYFLPQFAGQPECKLKFIFDSDYYHWLLDDIQLIEPECTNLKIMENFVAGAPYAQAPTHSVSNFPLIADIYNNGACTQTGTMLNVQLTDDADGSVLFEATKDFGSIQSDSLAENQMFDELCEMATDIGSYTLTYNLFSDSTDFDPSDNTISVPIVVTDNVFTLDNGTTNTYQPAGLATVPAWMDGNIYHMGNIEDGSTADIEFGMSSSEGLIGQFITVLLYEWTNSEQDPDATVQIDERTNVGFNVYEITGDEPEDGIIRLPFYNPLTGTPTIIEDNKSYVVLVQWAPPAEGLNLFLQYDERIDFSAASWATEQRGIHKYPTIGVVTPDSGNFDEDEDWSCFGASYGNSTAVPLIRLYVIEPDANENVLAEENLINLYPNPVVDQLTIQMNFVESVEHVRYDIYDINGKLIQSDRLTHVQQSKEQVNTRDYAPGTYHLKVISDLGVRAIPFIVQK